MKNINIVDSGLIRKKFAGTYIVQDKNEAALIEVSTSHAVPRILKRLEELNISPKNVKYVFVTHIHLDHAGGVGTLMLSLPNAKLIVHPTGAKHMIDPKKLIAGANAVYGEDVVKRDYGTITAIPKEKVIECNDNQDFFIGNRKLTTIYTPGHARHHISILDNNTKGIFTGDSMGLSYPEMDIDNRRFFQPTTTPTAFEYDKMVESINKTMSYNPKLLFFTHYGISEKPLEVANSIKRKLKDYKLIVESLKDFTKNQIPELEQLLSKYYIIESKKHGSILTDIEIKKLFDIDIKLNAMGLLLWKQREA